MDKIEAVGEVAINPCDSIIMKKTLLQWKVLIRDCVGTHEKDDNLLYERFTTAICVESVHEMMTDKQWARTKYNFILNRIWEVDIIRLLIELAFQKMAWSAHWRAFRSELLPGRQELESVFATGNLYCFTDERYRNAVITTLLQRALYITANGRIGLCVLHARAGDDVMGVYGSRVPFIFRSVDGEDRSRVYNMIGDCYLQGAMNGELFQSGGGTWFIIV